MKEAPMFCTGCGTQSADSDMFCGGCGNAQRDAHGKDVQGRVFRVGQAIQQEAIPDGIRGWSWGACLFPWIWAVGNNTWIGLLALIPYVNVPVMIWLGFKGREMAWRNRRWDSVDHFNRVQRAWSQWAVGITLVLAGFLMVCALIVVWVAANQTTQEADEAVVQQTDTASIRISSLLRQPNALLSDTKPAENHPK